MIEARELCKSYGSLRAVHDVTFSVGSGQIVGLLGPNGAGKSTVMKMLTGFHAPDSGTVRIAGFDTVDQTIDAQRVIGYVPENVPLYPVLTVEEYLRFICGARGLAKSDRSAATDRVVELCGLREEFRRPIGHLSKGYRQRVAIAQALIHDPAVLIFDEPTGGLDPHQVQRLREMIRSLATGRAVVLSTHVLSEVEAVCESVLILYQGRIIESGTPVDVARRIGASSSFIVEVAGAVTEAALAEISHMAPRTLESSDPTITRLRVAPREGEGGEDLYTWAVTHRIRLRSLAEESAPLERIFEGLVGDATPGEDHRG